MLTREWNRTRADWFFGKDWPIKFATEESVEQARKVGIANLDEVELNGVCCQLARRGWLIDPYAGMTVETVEEGEDFLVHLREFWPLACAECRADLAMAAEDAALQIKVLR